ncbi:dTMP kinase [Streptomyces sp. BH105]|uniref:dTMP kinase n=1 Tax=Streptomyces sp. BH105 TaxID=3410408 RepID=UPI003CF7EDBC
MTTTPGTFVTIDGPSGIGKSSTAGALRQELVDRGIPVWTTTEPSTSELGDFTRSKADAIRGHALACLVTANRYEHIETEIRPALHAGDTVVCDRYLASTLVLQQLDGVPADFILAINNDILLPDLAVILTAAPGLIAARIAERGVRHRFHLDPTAPAKEVDLYAAAARTLLDKGVRVRLLDTSNATPSEVASRIADDVPTPSVPSCTNPTSPNNTPQEP